MKMRKRDPYPFQRPAIGSSYLSPDGKKLTVAATWEQGVVFHGERCCTAEELENQYQPISDGVGNHA